MRIARVVVDISVAHLDRTFDYLIPPAMEQTVTIGSLVRIKWGPKRHNGWVVGVSDSATFDGELVPILRVVADRPLFTEAMLRTYRYLAQRFAVSLNQVLALAIPQRRAKVEKALGDPPAATHLFATAPRSALADMYGPEAADEARFTSLPLPRVVVLAVPHRSREQLRHLVANAQRADVPVIVTAPTLRKARYLHRILCQDADRELIGFCASEQDPSERYETHLRALRGDYAVVVGTRTALWTPFTRPTMTIIWEDGSPHYRERRHPQVDALDVALARNRFEDFGLMSASFSRSVKAQALVESRWARSWQADPTQVRLAVPRIQHIDSDSYDKYGPSTLDLLPSPALELIRTALREGPVLVQVASAGRRLLAACPGCSTVPRCAKCDRIIVVPAVGPLPVSVACNNCGERADLRQCGTCGHTPVVTRTVGADHVGRSVGRTFPNTKIVVSASSTQVFQRVDPGPQIVIATPGAEPAVEGGYACVIITDAHVSAYSERLAAPEEALRSWFDTFALARSRSRGMLCGEAPRDMVRALVMWRPIDFAHELLQQRTDLGFFPARWVVAIDGPSEDVASVVAHLESELTRLDPPEPPLQVMGTVRLEPDDAVPGSADPPGLFDVPDADLRVRTLVSCAPRQAMSLMAEVRSQIVTRSLQRLVPLQITVNPPELLPE